MDRENVIAKLEKEVKRTYSIKTTIYNNGKKVNEDITEHREPGIKISMEIADEILALLKEQEEQIKTMHIAQNVIADYLIQPEIVRCKDCIYGDDFDCPAPLPTGYLCQKGHGSHTGDWFCADGRKR